MTRPSPKLCELYAVSFLYYTHTHIVKPKILGIKDWLIIVVFCVSVDFALLVGVNSILDPFLAF